MKIKLDNCPQKGIEVDFVPNSVHVLVGKNGSGKSKIFLDIKRQTNVVFLNNQLEEITGVTSINLSTLKNDEKNSANPLNVASVIHSDAELYRIMRFFFIALFNIELKKDDNQFVTNKDSLAVEGDGIKSLFNLIYYLISSHDVIIIDEPERFLHPSLKMIFISILSEIARNYKKTILISSHSVNLIRHDLENVYIHQVKRNPPSILDIKGWLNDVSLTSYSKPKDKQQFIDWFYYHAEVVFSNKVLLVEGVSDKIILDAIKTKMSLQFNFEDISINHVASSHHETGGKGRLHKIQSFLTTLCDTYSLADKDIITTGDISKWDVTGNEESAIISESEKKGLFILSQGELEDYYFIDASYDLCSTVENAKRSGNKISASYEQARIIMSKSYEEVYLQFQYVIDILNKISGLNSNISLLLKELSYDFIVDKYVKGVTASRHLYDEINGERIKVKFNFAGSSQSIEYNKNEIDCLQKAASAIKPN